LRIASKPFAGDGLDLMGTPTGPRKDREAESLWHGRPPYPDSAENIAATTLETAC